MKPEKQQPLNEHELHKLWEDAQLLGREALAGAMAPEMEETDLEAVA